MRKLFIIAILALLPLSAFAWGVVSISGGVAAPADDYSDILFWWTCEDANLGADDYYGAGDGTATASGASIGTDGMKVGTNGIICATTYDYYALDSAGLMDLNHGRVGFYFNINTFAAGVTLLQANGSTSYIKLDVSDGGGGNGDYDINFKWRDTSTTRTALVTSSNLSSGTWYYIEAAWDVETNYREVWIDGTSVGSSSATINAGDATALWIGNNPNVAAVLYIDNVAISDDITRDLEALKDLTASPR